MERGERVVGCALGGRAVDATAAVALELSPWRSGVENVTDLDTARGKIFARSLNIGDDQVETLGRSWRGRMSSRCQTEPSTRNREA